MFSSAELIEALRRRGRRSLRPERAAGEFPPGWVAWFTAIGERLGAVTGASAEAIIAIFVGRELATPPRRTGQLNRWQSFATLWRQEWQPPAREDRWVRVAAYVITFVVHVLLLFLLLWLAYLRFTGLPAPQGEDVVQVQYVGEGTPEEQGGGTPAAATPAPEMASASAASAPAPARQQPASAQPSPPASAVASEPPEPPAPTPTGAQPLQVTEAPVPDTNFTLPPPTPPRLEMQQPQLTVPEVQVQTRDVEMVEAPLPVPATRSPLPPVEVTVPRVQVPVIQSAAAAPTLPSIQPREVAASPIAAPELKAQVPDVRRRDLPATRASEASNASASASSTATALPATGKSPSDNAPASGGPAAASSGTQTAASSGAGPAATPRPGAFPTPRRGDDWGASDRNRPGGNTGNQPGLFNADGSPRLPTGTADAGGGFPPGSDHWTRDQIDRGGTWLKRPPNDYTPTRFDQYWLPTGTLLEQWVRKGIREVAIPIPGTSKKINCVISMLQLGGACSISDPNLNDQEATARPPPDVPFKPDLQEDQDSLRKPGNP